MPTPRTAMQLRLLIVAALTGALGGFGVRAEPAKPAGEASQPIQLTVQVGFDGRYRPGTWTPLAITATNEGPPVSGLLEVEVRQSHLMSQAAPTTLYLYPIDLPTHSRKRLVVAAPVYQSYDPIGFRLLQDGRAVYSAEVPVRRGASTARFWLVLDRRAAGWNFLGRSDGAEREEVLYVSEPGLLPDGWIAYSALEAVIIGDFPTERLSSTQADALRDWVALGGRILLAPGAAAPLGAPPALLELWPVHFTGRTRTISLDPLAEGYAPLTGSGAALALDSSLADGRVVAQAEGLPLAVQRVFGQGRVAYLAAEPTAPPLLAWAGLGPLVRDLVGAASGSRLLSRSRNLEDGVWPVLRSHQLGGAFRGAVVGLWAVYGAALLFLTLRARRRPALWFATAGLGVCSGVLSYVLFAPLGLKAQKATVQVTLIELPPASPVAHLVTYAGLISADPTQWRVAAPGRLFLSRPLALDTEAKPYPLVIDQAGGLTVGPVTAVQFVPMVFEQVAEFALRVSYRSTQDRREIALDNALGSGVRNAMLLDKDRVIPLGSVEAGTRRLFTIPEEIEYRTGNPSAEWLAASAIATLRRDGNEQDSLVLGAMEALLKAIFRVEPGTAATPWTFPMLVAALDTTRPAVSFRGMHQAMSVQLIVVPLTSEPGRGRLAFR